MRAYMTPVFVDDINQPALLLSVCSLSVLIATSGRTVPQVQQGSSAKEAAQSRCIAALLLKMLPTTQMEGMEVDTGLQVLHRWGCMLHANANAAC